jgi:peptidoglycan/xylan/chitin deacetylase (PgdA/CDA1 family)
VNALAVNFARWQRSRGCLLTFHRASPANIWAHLPNRNFYLNLDYLDALLAYLVRNKWKIVTIEEVTRQLRRGEGDARLVNFSVDDCYRDTFEHVVPVFRRHGVPVTLFVTTGIPDGTLSLGWAGLESILMRRDRIVHNGLTIELPEPAMKRHWFAKISAAWEENDFDGQYAKFCEQNSADPAELRAEHAIDWDMLDALKADPLVEIGSHTISHPRVGALSDSEAFSELEGSRNRLRERLGIACDHFAFPYGRSGDCGPRDFDLARKAGFKTAATTRKGLVQSDQDVLSLPRNTVNGAYQSMAYINTLLSGLAGVTAKALGRV